MRLRDKGKSTSGHFANMVTFSNHGSILVRDEMEELPSSFLVLSKQSSMSRPLSKSNSRESGLLQRAKACPFSQTLTQQNHSFKSSVISSGTVGPIQPPYASN